MEAAGPTEPPKEEPERDGEDRSVLSTSADAPLDGGDSDAQHGDDSGSAEEDEDEDGDSDEEEEDEPELKYASLTKNLSSIYRNGDATSSFLVGGDKMIIGTHNGNVHVLSMPLFQSLRVYHAHSASVSCISTSPFPPPLPKIRLETGGKAVVESPGGSVRAASFRSFAQGSTKSPHQTSVPPTLSNQIYIATSSIDGNVCVSSLVDPKDVLLRNFGRPVQAVALSPDYKNDRTYLSGGLAGSLILTSGGRVGVSSNSTTMGGAAAAASGWLGSLGIGANHGKDVVLHSGEGAINTIKWSLSGKFICWVNEEGIKIMRSNLHLDSADSDFAWKRINHIDRPNRPGWEEMASVWKARAEWIDESPLDGSGFSAPENKSIASSTSSRKDSHTEKLIVGWGGTIWVIKVSPTSPDIGRQTRERKAGYVEVTTILRTDCVISGISLYSPNCLLVLAYVTSDEENPQQQQPSPRRGIHRKGNALEPELRLIDIETKEEVSADTLSFSRHENLSASDYHLGVLHTTKASLASAQRGSLETIGHGLWDATMYPARLFSSAASVRSNSNVSSDRGSSRNSDAFVPSIRPPSSNADSKELQAVASTSGIKIFIHSPYDCVVAVKRDLADRLSYLDSHGRYEEAWELIDQHPEAVSSRGESAIESVPGTPTRAPQGSLADFFADETSSIRTVGQVTNSAVEKEKRRVGELWLEQLVNEDKWEAAAVVSSKVLGTAPRWEHWIFRFTKAGKYDQITPHVPSDLHPPLPSIVYEVILGHYASHDRSRFKELLDVWSPDIFDVGSVIAAIEGQLKSPGMVPQSEEWELLTACLAKLFLAGGEYREALRCYVRIQDADAAMSLIKDHHLLDAVSDDIPGLILLRVSREQMKSAPIEELKEATSESMKLLVREAHSGIVPPATVVEQLEEANKPLYLYFYMRALWKGDYADVPAKKVRPRIRRHQHTDAANKLAADEGKALADGFADTVIELFADYDRPLLMEFLQSSTAYSFGTASSICETRHFIPELIYLLSKTGQTKPALNLILSDLKDVSQAISFCKSQDDPDLWDDLLTYSMDKPSYIHGLLTEAGTAIDPIKLVRRIPSGLEIEGLREGLSRMIREYDIQASISQGVARVLHSEVAIGMDSLRRGQRRGIKFDVIDEKERAILKAAIPEGEKDGKNGEENEPKSKAVKLLEPGRCAGCLEAFVENEKEVVVGFACGHVFHLSHLHPSEPNSHTHESGSNGTSTPSSQDRPQTTISVADSDADSPSPFASRTVAPKVINARLLRDKIGDGCRICAATKEMQKAAEGGGNEP